MKLTSAFIVASAAAGVSLSACGATNNPAKPVESGKSGVIVGNSGELPFDKQYQQSIALPMQEAQFLELLGRLHLQYSILGDRSKGLAIPNPRLSEKPGEDAISRVYQVYGGVDKSNRFGRVYRAFVNKSGEVIYIENAFEYPGM